MWIYTFFILRFLQAPAEFNIEARGIQRLTNLRHLVNKQKTLAATTRVFYFFFGFITLPVW
jgi:hypothetical protein